MWRSKLTNQGTLLSDTSVSRWKVLWENHGAGTAAAPVNGFATKGPSVGVSVGKCQYRLPFYLLWVPHMHITLQNKFFFFFRSLVLTQPVTLQERHKRGQQIAELSLCSNCCSSSHHSLRGRPHDLRLMPTYSLLGRSLREFGWTKRWNAANVSLDKKTLVLVRWWWSSPVDGSMALILLLSVYNTGV